MVHTHFYATFLHTSFNNTFARNSFAYLTSTRISCTHRSSVIYFLLPPFPIPFSLFFGCILEEVDMWGYPVLKFIYHIQRPSRSLEKNRAVLISFSGGQARNGTYSHDQKLPGPICVVSLPRRRSTILGAGIYIYIYLRLL